MKLKLDATASLYLQDAEPRREVNDSRVAILGHRRLMGLVISTEFVRPPSEILEGSR